MNDDQIRAALGRRSQMGTPDEHLAGAIRSSLVEPATPRRSLRLAPIGGLVAAVAIVVLVVATLPSLGPATASSSPTDGVSTSSGSTHAHSELSCHSPTEQPYAPVIVNETGLGMSCTLTDSDPPRGDSFVPGRPLVSNLDGNQSTLRISWFGNPCDAAARFTLSRGGDGYRLATELPVILCDDMGVYHAIVVEVHDGTIDAAQVAVSDIVKVAANPTSSPIANQTNEPKGARFDCSGPPLPPESTPFPGSVPTLLDETGLVINCTQPDYVMGDELDGAISVTDVAAGVVYVMWMSTPCDAEIVFTFRELADRYELEGVPPSTCQESGGSSSLQITFSEPIAAESIAASLTGVAVMPPPTGNPTTSSALIRCGPETDLRDHTSLVVDCDAETDRGVPTGDLTVSANGEGGLVITWPVVLDNCTPMRSQLEFWQGPDSGEYALEIQMSNPNAAPIDPGGPIVLCDAATGVHTARLTLTQSIDSAQVGAVLTIASPNLIHSSSTAEIGGEWFELSTSATKSEYASDEAIDVWSSLTSDNDVTVVCLSGPLISLQQLDGSLSFTPGPFDASCPGPRELGSHEPLTNQFLPAVWGSSDPHPLEQYIRDGALYLPPGTYRFTAASSFEVGGTRSPQLEASIVITVH